MDYLIREGRIHEMILVMPNAVNSLGGCRYENSPLTGNLENYVVDDVRHFVETRFRTIQAPAGRAIAGHGMGGVGALSIALKHPDLFGGVYALSPAVFDAAGLRDSGLLSSDRVRRLTEASANWAGENARHNFRDYMHQHLNSSSRERFFDALALSYGAAFASDLSRPFPHIALPRTGVENDGGVQNLYERGFGQWDRKLSQYLSGKARVNSITLECAGPGEYEWIRRGVNDLSERMGGLGMPHQLESHKGDHESLLRERIETAMLPALSWRWLYLNELAGRSRQRTRIGRRGLQPIHAQARQAEPTSASSNP